MPASSSWRERVRRIWPTKERSPMPIIINLLVSVTMAIMVILVVVMIIINLMRMVTMAMIGAP